MWLGQLARERLCPPGEVAPDRSLPEGNTRELDEHQESAGAKGDALDFVRGPEVVKREKEKETLGNEQGGKRLAQEEGNGPASEAGT
jgi:hypothetical protein